MRREEGYLERNYRLQNQGMRKGESQDSLAQTAKGFLHNFIEIS